jgi:hypothetical protein
LHACIAAACYEKRLNNHLERRFIYEIKILPIYIYEIACHLCFVFHSGFKFVKFQMIYQFTLVKGSGSPPNKALYEYISKCCVFESLFSLEHFIPIQISVHIKGPHLTEYTNCRLESRKLFQAEALEICTRMVSGSNISRGIDCLHLGCSFSHYLQENTRLLP